MGVPFDLLEEMNDSELKTGRFPDDTILLQYSGLKDKNGKEIYEGDVVRGIELGYENTGWENELRTGAVVFSKSGSWVYTVGSQEHQLLCYMKNPEILGNIYEHNHLLDKLIEKI